MFITPLFSRAVESLKDETRLLQLWVGSLARLPTFVLKPVHIFRASSRVSKIRLNVEPELFIYIYRYICIYIYKWSTTQSAQISQKQYERNIHAIMKTMYLLSYHHSGFIATHALCQMMYGWHMMYTWCTVSFINVKIEVYFMNFLAESLVGYLNFHQLPTKM